tara:strand:+ start:267 stop:638 length:372 start_codon:yes stop_codon:yes gene_type:complete
MSHSRTPSPIKKKLSKEELNDMGKVITKPSGWSYPLHPQGFIHRSLIPKIKGLNRKGPYTRSKKKKESKGFYKPEISINVFNKKGGGEGETKQKKRSNQTKKSNKKNKKEATKQKKKQPNKKK